MKSNPDDVLKTIPDFEELIALSELIAGFMFTKLSLEAKIKEGESNVFRIASADERYFQGGKPASSTYIENAWKFTGLDGELVPLRNELASVIAKLEGSRMKMDVFKNMIEIWRTLCSNQRSSSL